MKLDTVGINFLKQREGLRLEAYLDVAGIPTIGYGTTKYGPDRPVKLGDKVVPDEAEAYFLHDLEAFEKLVNYRVSFNRIMAEDENKELHVVAGPVTQNMYNALVALCYNIGGPEFGKSTVLKRVNSRSRNIRFSIAEAFMMWNKITVIKNGVKQKEVSPGLVNRRNKEIELYFS